MHHRKKVKIFVPFIHVIHWGKILTPVLLVISLFVGTIPVSASGVSARIGIGQSIGSGPKPIYLPIIQLPAPNRILLGTYTNNYIGYSSTITNEIKAIDTWSGKQLSLVGTFIDPEQQYMTLYIKDALGLVWNSGYTPFVNITTTKTLSDINSGRLDASFTSMAVAFKDWRNAGLQKGQNRKAFLAPLEEMNGNWVSWYGSPSDFKNAFARIKNIFNQQNASSAVRWVFAPNGWSDPNSWQFEDYYPGDSAVEVVAFSGYNYGSCKPTWQQWDNPDYVYGPYIQRLRAMAPTKPIIIAQTGVTSYSAYGYDIQSKNNWLKDAYTYLAGQPGILGVIYFNISHVPNENCDWPFYNSGGTKFDGYIQGVNRVEYIYTPPDQLAGQALKP
jgi:hypothetical protein